MSALTMCELQINSRVVKLMGAIECIADGCIPNMGHRVSS
jgi:hypothetical protein